MTRARPLQAALLLVGAAACEPPAPVPVLDPGRLYPVPAEEDPLADHRTAEDTCPPASWGAEEGSFEVQTGVCTYAAFSQVLDHALRPGDELVVSVWHDTLDAPEPATAHLAVLVDGVPMWDAHVEIPAPSGVLEAVIPVRERSERPILGLHLHNHGYNSWRFLSVDLHPR